MSESFYLCAASLCTCLVVCALVRLLAPTGNTTKIFSLVIGIFALCCLISPVSTFIKELDFNSVKFVQTKLDSQYSEIYDNQVLKTTGEYINSYADVMLKQSGISSQKIITVISVDENKGIYIREMNIYINKTDMDKAEKIKEIISTSVGVKPKITES